MMRVRLTTGIAVIALASVMTGISEAQTSTPPAPPARGYFAAVAQSAFGNVTSQSYGVEAGFRLRTRIDVFLEIGRVADVAGEDIGQNAETIAQALSRTQSNVSFTVAQPVTFFDAGARYVIPTMGKISPYVMAGLGIGRLKQDVVFRVNGTDVTNILETFGIVLGTDLTGTATKTTLVVGAGARYPIKSSFYADFQFRYNHIFTGGDAIPIGRAGLGLGFAF
jgi:opacity protein-like surface antigen